MPLIPLPRGLVGRGVSGLKSGHTMQERELDEAMRIQCLLIRHVLSFVCSPLPLRPLCAVIAVFHTLDPGVAVGHSALFPDTFVVIISGLLII